MGESGNPDFFSGNPDSDSGEPDTGPVSSRLDASANATKCTRATLDERGLASAFGLPRASQQAHLLSSGVQMIGNFFQSFGLAQPALCAFQVSGHNGR